MNEIQNIVLKIFKVMHPMVFAKNITVEEAAIKYKIDGYNLHTQRNIQIQKDSQDNTLLTWQSATGKTIACPVADIAFVFSQAGVFDDGIVLDILMYFHYDMEKIDIINEEIEDTKKLLNMLTSTTLFPSIIL